MQTIHPGASRMVSFGLPLLAALVVPVTIAPPAAAQTLQLYAGALAERREGLPLALPELALEPPFDDDVEPYRLRVSHTTTGMSVVVASPRRAVAPAGAFGRMRRAMW